MGGNGFSRALLGLSLTMGELKRSSDLSIRNAFVWRVD
jgi:hypothetical protein